MFDWPAGGVLRVPLRQVAAAHLLADPDRAPLEVMPSGDGVVISGPVSAPDPVDTVVVVEG